MAIRQKESVTNHTQLVTDHSSQITRHSSLIHLPPYALCTISESGTISEESAILSFPAISFRNSLKRPEAQDAWTIILREFEPDIVLTSIETAINEHKQRYYNNDVPDYTITDTSWRVLKLILGQAGLSNLWQGIK
jgi:UDP-N-acetylglucosamine 2-epimerase (non-hydrolysing)